MFSSIPEAMYCGAVLAAEVAMGISATAVVFSLGSAGVMVETVASTVAIFFDCVTGLLIFGGAA